MTNQTLEETLASVMAAGGYIDVFGMPPVNVSAEDHVKQVFRRLQKLLHPDRYLGEDDKRRATDGFTQLTKLHDEAQRALRMGRFGEATQLVTMHTRQGEHIVLSQLGRGDLASVFLAESKLAGTRRDSVLKVVSNHRNNDLMKTEARALKLLRGPDTDPAWHRFVPELLDSFVYTEARKPRRQVNALAFVEDAFTIEELRRYFPQGVHPLHVAWMWRRLLVTLAFAHDSGVVHGAVLPRHVMILPSQHGLVLADWCYASIKTDNKFPALTALVNEYRDWYPQEVFDKQPPSPATDIYMAVKSMIYLLGGNPLTNVMPDTVPQPMRAFFRGCLQTGQQARPQNAWLLFQEFDELLERMGKPYFPRKYREFVVPTGTTTP